MVLKDAQDTLAIRLYDWASRDLARELEQDCPLLSLISQNNRRIGAFALWNKTLTSSERNSLARALTRRVHFHAVELIGEKFTEEDENWATAFYEQTTHYMNEVPPLDSSDKTLPTYEQVDVELCLDAVAASSSIAIGKPVRRRSSVYYTRKIGDWKIVTDYTFERRHENLVSTYQFIRKDDHSEVPSPEIGPRPFPRSLLACYGVYNRTVVAVPSRLDGERMGSVLVKLTEHLVSQAGPLFSGLDRDCG